MEHKETDASSIKPVSSLLSHFEHLNKPESEGATRLSRSQSPNSRPNRPSLDAPAHSDFGRSPQRNDYHGLETPSSATVTNGARQRPHYTGPQLAAQYSPYLTVEPPSSPPKTSSPNLSKTIPSDYLSAETSSSPVSTPRQHKIPTKSHTTPPSNERSSSSQLSLSPSRAPEPPPRRRSPELRRDPPAKSSPRPPPPINRAEKPKIPAKPSADYGNARASSQGLARPELPGPRPRSPHAIHGAYSESDSTLPPPMPSRPIAQDTRVPVRSTNAVFDTPPPPHYPQSRRRDYNDLGIANASRNSIEVEDERPALPARPRLPPSRSASDLTKWTKAPDDSLRGRHSSKPDVQRPPENSDPAIYNSKRNVSTPIPTNVSTPPSSHDRSVTVGNFNGQVKDNYKPPTGLDQETLGTSITRPTLAAPQNRADTPVTFDYPDPSRSNRRPPFLKNYAREVPIKYDSRLFDVVGEHACTAGVYTRVWSLATGEQVMGFAHGETIKILSISFKAAPTPAEEGQKLWLGNSVGDIVEMDVPTQSIVATKNAAHNRHEVIKIIRHANTMWTLDDVGTLQVWAPDMTGSPSLDVSPQIYRLPRGHTFSLVAGGELWYATGKDLRVFHPTVDGRAQFQLLQRPLCQSGAGDIVSGTTISSQPDRVYFGHSDGKITIYARDTFACIGILNVSVYKINTLAGVGQFLWAGFNTGGISIYDTRETPWTMKKDWRAHSNPVIDILVDRSYVWEQNCLKVVSLGADNTLRLWDGLLEDDWLESDLKSRDVDFCEFENVNALVMTWNAGASTPSSLRHAEQDSAFVRNLLSSSGSPDIVIFGFQELVDLEDKKTTAMSFFKSKKKDSSEHEHMSHQYRDWRDYLTRCLDDYTPDSELYHLLQSAAMVGLFTCVFVKSHLRGRVKGLTTTEVKRGMGGLHGNKGAIIVRFIIDDTSACFVNCHLAAGQTQTKMRNQDITAILESNILPVERDPTSRIDTFVGGGDGSMVLDHEVCIVNGDMNYRIDTMSRDAVVNSVKTGNLEKLLERDQLLVSKRKNPGFRLRYFNELPITFAPTYKYDVGSDTYDSSEKKRAPAWCDRILYRDGHHTKRIQQYDYRRHDVRVSDHRPVTASFDMIVKSVVPEERVTAWNRSRMRFERVKQETLTVNPY